MIQILLIVQASFNSALLQSEFGMLGAESDGIFIEFEFPKGQSLQ